jgi:hypothetical protein
MAAGVKQTLKNNQRNQRAASKLSASKIVRNKKVGISGNFCPTGDDELLFQDHAGAARI